MKDSSGHPAFNESTSNGLYVPSITSNIILPFRFVVTSRPVYVSVALPPPPLSLSLSLSPSPSSLSLSLSLFPLASCFLFL